MKLLSSITRRCEQMPKAGDVEVQMSVEVARATAHWLSTVYVPAELNGPPGLLGLSDSKEEIREEMITLAAKLMKSAVRKRRSPEFPFTISRQTAEQFIYAVKRSDGVSRSTLFITARAPRADLPEFHPHIAIQVRQAQNWMQLAYDSHQGRPRLSTAERDVRIAPGFNRDARQKRRLAREQRIQRAWENFVRAGGALLGSSVPFPEI
jgi:hypothetical protein